MTKTKIICDHCGKELDTTEDFTDIKITCGGLYERPADLCEECFHKLCIEVNKFCSKGFEW